MCVNNQYNGMTMDDSCSDKAVAMAYVPWQYFSKAYEPQKALMIGTIFPELDKPFLGRKGGNMR